MTPNYLYDGRLRFFTFQPRLFFVILRDSRKKAALVEQGQTTAFFPARKGQVARAGLPLL